MVLLHRYNLTASVDREQCQECALHIRYRTNREREVRSTSEWQHDPAIVLTAVYIHKLMLVYVIIDSCALRKDFGCIERLRLNLVSDDLGGLSFALVE
jgi:hypothetical protein